MYARTILELHSNSNCKNGILCTESKLEGIVGT